jgi:cell division septum initiation protein DivIVA
MPKPSPSGDRGPLERLCGDEVELERSLAEARRAAAEVLSAARDEAERLTAEVRGELTRDLASLRAQSELELRLEAERAEAAAGDVAAGVASRAERNRPRALELLLAVVLGRGPP